MTRRLFAVLLLTTVSAFAEDKPVQEPATLVHARKAYEAKVKAAVDPITDAYLKQLDEMKKAFGARGDLASAQAVQKEINSLKHEVTLIGKWKSDHGAVLTFNQDGTATIASGEHGQWRCLDKKARKYVVVWRNGPYTDYYLLSANGNEMTVRTRSGLESAIRIAEGP